MKSLILLTLLLIPSIMSIPLLPCNALHVNVWGNIEGEARIYELKQDMQDLNGHLIGTLEHSYIQYNTINIQNLTIVVDFTELNLIETDYSTVPETITFVNLLDIIGTSLLGSYAEQIDNILFGQLFDGNLFDSIRNAVYSLLLPTQAYEELFMGFLWVYHGVNWTVDLNEINATYPGYTAYNYSDYTQIEYMGTNVYDPALLENFNGTGTIIWDLTTGWLQSLEYVRTYESPLNFILKTTVIPYSGITIPEATGGIVLKDIFAWLGLGIGIAGLCFALYAIKKAKTPQFRWVE
ncbi:MAG: hypothetical protein ACTSRC_07655 [Candidatus Helarchaeota archaeon]